MEWIRGSIEEQHLADIYTLFLASDEGATPDLSPCLRFGVLGILLVFMAVGGLASDRSAVAAERHSEDAAAGDPSNWPPITEECRPWTYWWWMGSAVDAENLTRELERYRKAGMGGMHIVPIYGAKGYEDRYIEYLSPKWMAMLRRVGTETRRLGMGVDMTIGTGWCFGGPNIAVENADAIAVAKTFDLAEGEKLAERFDRHSTQALVAFSAEGKAVDILEQLAADGSVAWTAPAGKWRVYAVSQKPGMRVKRRCAGRRRVYVESVLRRVAAELSSALRREFRRLRRASTPGGVSRFVRIFRELVAEFFRRVRATTRISVAVGIARFVRSNEATVPPE